MSSTIYTVPVDHQGGTKYRLARYGRYNETYFVTDDIFDSWEEAAAEAVRIEEEEEGNELLLDAYDLHYSNTGRHVLPPVIPKNMYPMIDWSVLDA